MAEARGCDAVAFALIYLTFFLDNVLLTVLVPVIPDWLRADSLQQQQQRQQLNGSSSEQRAAAEDAPGSQAVVGLVLGAKAGAQLACAPLAGAAVARSGPTLVLRGATGLLAAAALVFAVCSGWGGAAAAWSVGLGRVAHGAGAALGGVAGLALAAGAPAARRQGALGALLGAVALGVLVGYPLGGVTYAFWNRSASFVLLAAALLADLAMQCMFLRKEEVTAAPRGVCWRQLRREAARGCVAACAGGVLLTTAAMAALEPSLPQWVARRFHPAKWALGLVFLADSAGYVLATAAAPALGAAGAERAALLGQAAVGLAALALPYASSVSGLALPQAALGLGLGALDGALVPALAARTARVHLLAALLQAASSAAYTLGPVLGGLLSAWLGFESSMRALGVANLLYAAHLYRALARHPLTAQWGATSPEDSEASEDEDQETPCLAVGSPLPRGRQPLASR